MQTRNKRRQHGDRETFKSFVDLIEWRKNRVRKDAESINAAVGCYCRLSLPMRTSDCLQPRQRLFSSHSAPFWSSFWTSVSRLSFQEDNKTTGATETVNKINQNIQSVTLKRSTMLNVDWHHDTGLVSNSTRTNWWGTKTSVSEFENQDIIATCKLHKSLLAKGILNWRG